MPANYDLIADITPTSGVVDILNIPQTYKNLLIVFELESSSAHFPYIQLGTSSGYAWQHFASRSGNIIKSYQAFSQSQIYLTDYSIGGGTRYVGEIFIPDYTHSEKHSLSGYIGGVSNNFVGYISGGWQNTNYIYSVEIRASAGSFQNNSKVRVYGLV